jgi:hypothetical protein
MLHPNSTLQLRLSTQKGRIIATLYGITAGFRRIELFAANKVFAA